MKLFKALKTRWIVWVWNHTPTCAEMSRLASLSFEQPPSLKVRCKMWLHYLICVWCKRYLKHLKFLHRAAPRVLEESSELTPGLSAEARERLKQALRDDLK